MFLGGYFGAYLGRYFIVYLGGYFCGYLESTPASLSVYLPNDPPANLIEDEREDTFLSLEVYRNCTTAELQKRADRADQSVLFFLAGANFWEKHAKNC